PAPVGGEPVAIGAPAPRRRREVRAQGPSRRAERGGRGHRGAGALGGRRRPGPASRPPAGGARPPLLRRPVRSGDRQRDGHLPRRREESYGTRHDRATQRPGAVLMTTDPYDEHGEILRRALQAEAESVIPSDDRSEEHTSELQSREN